MVHIKQKQCNKSRTKGTKQDKMSEAQFLLYGVRYFVRTLLTLFPSPSFQSLREWVGG